MMEPPDMPDDQGAAPQGANVFQIASRSPADREGMLLTLVKPRLADFCQWFWPAGETKGQSFYPYPHEVPTRIRLTGADAGYVFDVIGNRTCRVFDLIREEGVAPEKMVSEWVGNLPRVAARPRDDQFGDITFASHLAGRQVKDRDWIVPEWLPVGVVTSLYGAAGVGKSLIAQHLQTAVGTGQPFLGLPTNSCRTLGFYCEDDDEELHRRQIRINAALGVSLKDLGNNVAWQGRYGRQNVMTHFEDGIFQPADFYEFVRDTVATIRPGLLILDNIAQLFGGNENVRPEVTQFVNALGLLAREYRCAVLLLGHPGKATDSQFSGSTAWDACVRSRLLLERPTVPEGADHDDDFDRLRVLRKAKANYSGIGEDLTLAWEDGAFRLEGGNQYVDMVDRIERNVREREDDEAFLRALDTLTEQGRPVSHSKKAENYAPKIMVTLPNAGTKAIGGRRLEQAMARLFDRGAIKANVRVGRRADNRNPLYGIARTEVHQGSHQGSERPSGTPENSQPAPHQGSGACTKVDSQPIDFIAPEGCTKDAPRCTKVDSQPIDFTAPRCTALSSHSPTENEGGALRGAPPSNEPSGSARAADAWQAERLSGNAPNAEDKSP